MVKKHRKDKRKAVARSYPYAEFHLLALYIHLMHLRNRNKPSAPDLDIHDQESETERKESSSHTKVDTNGRTGLIFGQPLFL
jgi:hypothetical protein